MNPNVLRVQKRLAELGYEPGPLDGVRGRRTIAAVRRFQQARGLTVDGLVGRNTYAALFQSDERDRSEPAQVIDDVPWIEEARRVQGLHERRDNQSLWSWLRRDGATVGDPARIPWCGDFVQTAIALSMPEEPIPENPYLAANWTKFGYEVDPQFGAILVFWRGSPSSWKGHVGFYIGETNDHFLVLGGNQSNMVNESLISKDRLRVSGARWPGTGLEPSRRRVLVDGRGRTITTNEA